MDVYMEANHLGKCSHIHYKSANTDHEFQFLEAHTQMELCSHCHVMVYSSKREKKSLQHIYLLWSKTLFNQKIALEWLKSIHLDILYKKNPTSNVELDSNCVLLLTKNLLSYSGIEWSQNEAKEPLEAFLTFPLLFTFATDRQPRHLARSSNVLH